LGQGEERKKEGRDELTSPSPSLFFYLTSWSLLQVMIPWKFVVKAEIEETDERSWREKMSGMYF